MVDMKETVQEQAIFTRSIGKSANEISEQSDLLNKTEARVRRMVFGAGSAKGSSAKSSGASKDKVVGWVQKMKKEKAA